MIKLKTTYRIRFFLLFLIQIVLFSCTSINNNFGKKGVLQGMVYDFENRPVPGYKIEIEGISITETDFNGRFSLLNVPWNTHKITGKNENYIFINKKINFSDPREIYYFRIPSNEWLYCEVDKNISQGKYNLANENLERFSLEEKKNNTWDLYNSVTIYLINTEFPNLTVKDEMLEHIERIQKQVINEN